MKDFVINYPDEPYSSSFAIGKSVTARYKGFRYLVLAVDRKTKFVQYVAQSSNESMNFDLNQYHTVPDTDHVAIDAWNHPLEAAFITSQYEVAGEIPDYEFVHKDGSTWTYTYGKDILSTFFVFGEMKYHIETSSFEHPPLQTHPITRESFFESVESHKFSVEKALAERTFLDEDRQKLVDFHKWLVNLPALMEDVPHWKVIWPRDIPIY